MKTNQPLVTIITPTYNSSRFINQTIKSVQSQTYSNWEMIIIDDSSSDNTLEKVNEQQNNDNRIKVIELKENSGAAVARNTGIKNAQGKYLAFLDSDDFWESTKLEKQVNFMMENNYLFTYSSYSIMNESGKPLDKSVIAPEKINYRFLLRSPGSIGCLTVMLDRENIDDILMPNIKTRQDFALWLKILKKGITAYGINEKLSRYRIVPGSISSNKVKAAKKNWFVYRKIEKLNIIQASWYFMNYAFRALKKTFL